MKLEAFARRPYLVQAHDGLMGSKKVSQLQNVLANLAAATNHRRRHLHAVYLCGELGRKWGLWRVGVLGETWPSRDEKQIQQERETMY